MEIRAFSYSSKLAKLCFTLFNNGPNSKLFEKLWAKNHLTLLSLYVPPALPGLLSYTSFWQFQLQLLLVYY
jgi:hypothetical protein